MALPGSRDYDAIDGGPLPATTVNNIQDAIVALEAARIAILGARTIQMSAAFGNTRGLALSVLAYQSNDYWIIDPTGLNGPGLPIFVPIGARLIDWGVTVRCFNGADAVGARLFQTDGTNVGTAGIGAEQTTSLLVDTLLGLTIAGGPLVVPAGRRYFIDTNRQLTSNADVWIGEYHYSFDLLP